MPATDTAQIDAETAPLLRVRGVSKSFPGVRALVGVDLTLRAAEVHALTGENGSGKSTLAKIIGGAHQPDAGIISGTAARSRSGRLRPRCGAGSSPSAKS